MFLAFFLVKCGSRGVFLFVVFIAVRRREFKGNILGLLRVGTVALVLRVLCRWGASLDSPGCTRITLEGLLAAKGYSPRAQRRVEVCSAREVA